MKKIIFGIILIGLAGSSQCQAGRSDKSETDGSFLTERSVNNGAKAILLTERSVNNGTDTTFLTDRSVKNAHGLPVGAPAPMFSALDAENKTFSLKEALQKGPVVMIFYRGHWCPVCNKHLGQIQDSLKRLPIPATYIIDQDGKIAWRQFDPNYKNRSSVKEIIENLP